MRKLLLLAVTVLLCACTAQKIQSDLVFSEGTPPPMVRETLVEAAFLPADPLQAQFPAPPGLEAPDLSGEEGRRRDDFLHAVCDGLEGEAWLEVHAGLMQGFVRERVVLQPAEGLGRVQDFSQESGRITGYCQPVRDEFSGQFLHKVAFEAKLVPVRRFVGVINALQDGQTMAGMGSWVYVTLMDPEGMQAPLPVVVVQHQEGLDPRYVRVVGSGVIFQLFGSQGQMAILESAREIVAGDSFFALQVRGRFIQDAQNGDPFAPGVWRGIPSVSVQPVPEVIRKPLY